ncbi:MAG TPA: O-antigen ligase family protein [Gemmatimonadaceae bacterium]|nr:O-antigen ligase family protein [Gemmatimonadaceae bacterium]
MANRIAAILLQVGIVAVIIAAAPYKLFELDRYFVPKELVLHVVALFIAIVLVVRRRTISIDLPDALIALFLAWSAASALFATNHWAGQRALGLSVSSALIFWGARRLGTLEMFRPILIAAAFATVLASAASLAQTYGFQTDYFSLNRAPGGTLGNRNFVAHIAAIGLPAVVWSTVTSRHSTGALLGSLGVGVLGAALVLSRSRAAWLAVVACVIVLAGPLFVSRNYWEGAQVGGRLSQVLLAGALGGIVAIALPNKLNWASDSPYLDSARGMVDYSTGSGRGRVAQYENSFRMARAHPVFGVGPGNWPVRYVRYAPANDRSLGDDGMTANPWPSSDWVAFVSERGFVAAIALLLVFVTLFFRAFRGWREGGDGSVAGEPSVPGEPARPPANGERNVPADAGMVTGNGVRRRVVSDRVLLKLALAGTIVATIVVSAFDAVLLLAAPAFLIWSVVGAATGGRVRPRPVELSDKAWRIAAAGTLLIVIASAARSATQMRSMAIVGRGGQTAGWLRGAAWDPASYRINIRVADLLSRRGRCATARPHARRALALFPHSPAAKRLVRRCR